MFVEEIALSLHAIGAFKVGSFKLKSGINSPFYIDLRLLVSYPQILRSVADLMWDLIKDEHFDLLCGVPYTALPIATAISLKSNIPMVMKRKEAKEHGLKKMVEGAFEKGQDCLVIEDLITSGTSTLETIHALEAEGLKISGAAVLIDREQGGRKNLESKGYKVFSLLSLTSLLETLEKHSKINHEASATIKTYIESTSVEAK